MAEKAVYEDKILKWKTHPGDNALFAKLQRPIMGKYRKLLLNFGHYIITLKNGRPVALLCYNILQHKKHYGKPTAQIEFYNLDPKKGQMHLQRLIGRIIEIHPDITMIYGRTKKSGTKLLKNYAANAGLKLRSSSIKKEPHEILSNTSRDVFIHLPKIKRLIVK